MVSETPSYKLVNISMSELLLMHACVYMPCVDSDYIPTIGKCEVNNSITNSPQHEQNTWTAILSLSWQLNHSIIDKVRRYDIYCDCAISGHHIEEVCLHIMCTTCIVAKD